MARINWYGNRVFTLATEANVHAMKTAAYVVEKDAKESIQKQAEGNLYYIGRSKKTRRRTWYKKPGKGRKEHRASRPGEPPAIDTGILRSSIMSEVEETGMNVIGRVGPDVEYIAAKAPIGTNVEYGYYLETGTAKMEARPFLRPSLHRTRKEVVRIFKEANK